MRDVDSSLIGFNIEILFSFTEPDGNSYLDWCHGMVVTVMSMSARKAKIKWDEEHLRQGDPTHTVEKLLKTQLNSAIASWDHGDSIYEINAW